jgi:outer membrane protein OmpA-like peptidoglycan-associated protein/tetratricopeptide (TPR) repeat protein
MMLDCLNQKWFHQDIFNLGMTQRVYIRIGLILALVVGISSASFAQLKKANNYFKQDQFNDAIKYYEKVLKKNGSNIEATQNIAFAYRKLKDYKNAEVYYAKATEINPTESANFLYYGQTLKNNNKVAAAKIQFEKFVASNPSSFMGKLMVKSCGDIKDWEVDEKAFEVSNLENINTKNADFCPLIFEDGIVFVSERGIDLVNENNYGMSNQPYLSIFFAREDKQYRKAKHFSNQLNSLYHDGPVSISADGKSIYFTRVDKKEQGKSYTNKLKIYSATLDGRKWKNVTPFIHNSSSYSVAHPWISEDGKKLFFASDMPGGIGGMDLYVSTKQGEEWGKPINLGNGVNTLENEVFPYFRKGVLYFSSEGHSGYGGLDVYSVKEEDKWKNPENLKAPLNSSKDDFGIYYKDDENGYFSSNREGGKGSDDIYSFSWHTLSPQTSMSGLLEYDKLASSGTTINLLDADDNVVYTAVTDEYGKFKFDKLGLDDNYLLSIDADDDSFLEGAKLYLTNSNGEKVLLANKVGKGKFKFQALPFEYYDGLEQLKEEDESLFTISVFGQVYQKLPGDYSGGMEIWVVDDEGNIIGKAKADKDGKFSFDKLSPNDEYLFMLAEDDETLNMIIVDENGNVMDAAKRLIEGKYRYIRLDSDQNVITLINEIDEVIKIAENENFIISKVLYDYRSAEINETAAKELDKLVAILKKNKDVGVELSSHTDSKGSDSYNMQLSQKRADAAVEYVVSKGIVATKIIPKGFGETQPVAPNELPNGKDNPEGRAKNRRTEFKVIKLK